MYHTALLLLLLIGLASKVEAGRRRRDDTNNQCPNNDGSSDKVRQMFLYMHNSFRSSVALGKQSNGLGGNAPTAAKMLRMVGLNLWKLALATDKLMGYDCDVETSALRHAEKCVFEHSSSADRPGLGENIFMTTARNYDKVEAALQASKTWWEELSTYGVDESNKLSSENWTKIGHYSQMAWDRTNRIGCGVAHCPDSTLVVCQYGPAGNYLNSLIYTVGEPCSECASTCDPSEGLCDA